MCGALILLFLMLLCFLYINNFQEIKGGFHSIFNYLSSFITANNSKSENEKFKNITKKNPRDGDNKVNFVLESNKYNTTDNKDLIYYKNDMINQSNINENAYDIVHQIDKIDYSNVKTGIEKCREECGGTCFEMGYTGDAICYPKQTKTFDYGTLYKNPVFSYGTNAYKPSYLTKD